MNCSKIVATNYPIKINHFHMLCTSYIIYLMQIAQSWQIKDGRWKATIISNMTKGARVGV
jgi:hypothetical protein